MADEVASATNQTPQIQAGQDMPTGGKTDPGAFTEAEFEAPPAGQVNFAPESADMYTIPELIGPDGAPAHQVMADLREGAYAVGFSTAEVEILGQALQQPDAIWDEAGCDRALASLWGSPQEVESRLGLITEAFHDQIIEHWDLLDQGLGNNPTLLNMLYQAAQRRLGRY
jgi:hypothetical protein